MKKVLANIFKEDDIEITLIELFSAPSFKYIIVGNSKGGIATHCYFTGKIFSRNSGHKSEISEIKIDQVN